MIEETADTRLSVPPIIGSIMLLDQAASKTP
jgi:hypothetical protein